MKAENIHFSIDDVILTLRWLKNNKPDSIFDMNFYNTLRQWHERYGLQFSLYVFEECDGFSIGDLPQQYWDEFKENTSWLKFCWHRRKAGILEDDIKTEIDSFKRVKNIICNSISPNAWTETVRLHRYQASTNLISQIKEKGNIQCLLCADDRISYDLTELDAENLNNHTIIVKNGIRYYKTDICMDLLEQMTMEDFLSFLTKTNKLKINKDKKIVVFCHEWMFHRIDKKMKEFLQNIMNEFKREGEHL